MAFAASDGWATAADYALLGAERSADGARLRAAYRCGSGRCEMDLFCCEGECCFGARTPLLGGKPSRRIEKAGRR